jgi:hypothetical protein
MGATVDSDGHLEFVNKNAAAAWASCPEILAFQAESSKGGRAFVRQARRAFHCEEIE